MLASPHFDQDDSGRNVRQFCGPEVGPLADSCHRWVSVVFVMQDSPAHSYLRRLVGPGLTPKRISNMTPRIGKVTVRYRGSAVIGRG